MIGFVIWSLFGVFIIGLGIKDMFSKNPVGFWANTETIKVKDVKGYNRASGLLFIIYGIIFVILGIPLLEGQNTPYVLLSVVKSKFVCKFIFQLCGFIYATFIFKRFD